MKKIFKTFGFGVVFGLWILLVLWIGYWAIKARQSTNPWIADDGQGMYASVGGTLNAWKWNTLVKRATWEDVATSDTNPFDINCDRRFESNNVLRWPTAITTANIYTLSTTPISRKIDSTNKTKNVNSTNTTVYYTVTKLQKKCQ